MLRGEASLPIQAKHANSGVSRLEFDAGRIVRPTGLIGMKRATSQLVGAARHSSERLDARGAKDMTTGEDMFWDLAHAAEASGVADEIGRVPEARIEASDHLVMKLRDLVFLGHRVISALTQPLFKVC
jgi:hypothetical protein